jgi:phospholipid transport system transporter-binding protein
MADEVARSQLSGVLDFASVPEVWAALARRIRQSRRLVVSLAGVEKANSAALALLLEGLELARDSGCELEYREIPGELLELARVSNVEALLLGGQAASSAG